MERTKPKQENILIKKYYDLQTELINNSYFKYMNTFLKITRSGEHTYINLRIGIPTIVKKEHFNFLFELANKYKCIVRIVNNEFRFEEEEDSIIIK